MEGTFKDFVTEEAMTTNAVAGHDKPLGNSPVAIARRISGQLKPENIKGLDGLLNKETKARVRKKTVIRKIKDALIKNHSFPENI